MTAKLEKHRAEYHRMAAGWLRNHLNGTAQLSDVETGIDAWTIAHRSGIVRHAYAQGRDVVDAHIQTMLESIMPNAVFNDPKRY